ncbi:MAG: serine/threonine-protein kinase [Leptolyngbyaceae cyanobacterium bins.59]|nr:serine/threonine-protein kinase [Leptolyngbyaceae cyanobacterium bins.59]
MLDKVLSGRYQITRHLGSGGFGQTFLAEDLHLPDRQRCVVKQLKPQNNHPDALEIARTLFNREARVLHQLGDHPQIPRLFAHFEENHEFYLVQEYIDGQDLSQELLPGKIFSQSQVLTLLSDIFAVLKYVHDQDVIHRDLKPSNLIRRHLDRQIFMIDFGAVKQISTQTGLPTGQTSLTVAIGSPGYMPNEQYSGKPRFCSDIYAVGMIAIQALTGIVPTKLPEDPETGELIWREQAQVSPDVAAILDRMIRYDFRQRYQTVDQVMQALATIPQCASTIGFSVQAPSEKSPSTIASAQSEMLPPSPYPTTQPPSLSDLPTEKVHEKTAWFSQVPQVKLALRTGLVIGAVGLLGGGYSLYQRWHNQQQAQAALAEAQTLQQSAQYQACLDRLNPIAPLSSASGEVQHLLMKCRFGLAQTLAKTGQLSEAMTLATQIPDQSSLAPEVKKSLNQWAEQLLKQATENYQQGRMKEATALVKAIPASTTIAQTAQTRLTEWQKAWKTDHDRWKAAQTAQKAGEWQKVLTETSQISKIPFWEKKTAALITTAQARLAESTAQVEIPSVPANSETTPASVYDPGIAVSNGTVNPPSPANPTETTAPVAPAYIPPAPVPVAEPVYTPPVPSAPEPVYDPPPDPQPEGCSGSRCE